MSIERYYELLTAALQSNESIVQATVIATQGSCPAEPGTKALFGATGLLAGTTGGGALEMAAEGKAREMLKDGLKTAIEHFALGADLGMVCGGTADVFFENLSARGWRVVVFGAGHVAAALINCLKNLAVDIVCVDHRNEWLERLPSNTNVQPVHVNSYPDYVEKLRETDYVTIMTPGHSFDFEVVERILAVHDLPYCAVIGSKRKAAELHANLAVKFSDERARSVICPAGLPFGSNAPEEIAISVVAQMLMTRDNTHEQK